MTMKDTKLSEDIANFIQLISNWFDIICLYTTSASIAPVQAYDQQNENQNKVLNEIISVFHYEMQRKEK